MRNIFIFIFILPLWCHQHLGLVMSHLGSVFPSEVVDVITIHVAQAA